MDGNSNDVRMGRYAIAARLPHVGMRKIKSVIAVFLAFCFWHGVRLIVPGLELHPIFMYIYSLIEIRDTSEKTISFGKLRIKATFTALGTGLPFLALSDYLKSCLRAGWGDTVVEVILILLGVLVTLMIAEKVGCKTFCGLAAAIFIILMVSHADDARYIYAVLRAFQTIAGVFVAWVVNVVLWPYSGKPEAVPDVKAEIPAGKQKT